MKEEKLFVGPIVIGNWNKNLKIATVILGTITVILFILLVGAKVVVPGLLPIVMGTMFLLLGVRSFNIYFKNNKSEWRLMLGIICTLVFVGALYRGINQIIDACFYIIY